MACTGCSKRRNRQATTVLRVKENLDMSKDENFKLITYHDGGTHSRMVVSPTKVISDYNMANYGLKRPGRQFYVHVDDIKHSPHKFVLVKDEVSENVLPNVNETKGDEHVQDNVQDNVSQKVDKTEEIFNDLEPSVHYRGTALRNALPHTEFAKEHDVHHLKVHNAYHKTGILEGFVGEDGKTYIYTDQEFGE